MALATCSCMWDGAMWVVVETNGEGDSNDESEKNSEAESSAEPESSTGADAEDDSAVQSGSD